MFFAHGTTNIKLIGAPQKKAEKRPFRKRGVDEVVNQLCVMNKAQKQAEERNAAKGALLQVGFFGSCVVGFSMERCGFICFWLLSLRVESFLAFFVGFDIPTFVINSDVS